MNGDEAKPKLPPGSGRLVLGLRPGRSLYIGRDVRLYVVKTEPDGLVRFAIEAPKFRAVSRDDVPFERHLEICDEKERSSVGGGR